LERHQLIQALIDRYNFSTYLELGVRDGNVFFTIKCKNKIAVDPHFNFGWKQRIKKVYSSFIGSRFIPKISDDFFSLEAEKILGKRKLDIVLVDGMHEFDYALNDILNSLGYLSKSGYIIVHDCNPQTQEASCSYEEWKSRGYSGVWNGDVWKAIYYLIQNRKDLEIFTIESDHGLGVIKRTNKSASTNEEMLSRSFIRNLSFRDLDKNRAKFLNLKHPDHIYEII